MPHRIIPIQVAGAPMVSVDPRLQGPADAIERVLGGLESVVDPKAGDSIVALRWIRALRLDDGEADLTLTVPPTSPRGRWLAEQSFGVLRSLLPDTDIYVRYG